MPERATITSTHIDSILQEQRRFPPSEEFRRAAHIKSAEEYERIYAKIKLR